MEIDKDVLKYVLSYRRLRCYVMSVDSKKFTLKLIFPPVFLIKHDILEYKEQNDNTKFLYPYYLVRLTEKGKVIKTLLSL